MLCVTLPRLTVMSNFTSPWKAATASLWAPV
jgi:hypothetical protein